MTKKSAYHSVSFGIIVAYKSIIIRMVGYSIVEFDIGIITGKRNERSFERERRRSSRELRYTSFC